MASTTDMHNILITSHFDDLDTGRIAISANCSIEPYMVNTDQAQPKNSLEGHFERRVVESHLDLTEHDRSVILVHQP